MAAAETLPLAASAGLGRAKRIDDARGRYIESVKNSFPKGFASTASRSSSIAPMAPPTSVAPTALWELGAEVVPIGVAPDGTNINHECGADPPALHAGAVVATRRRHRHRARRRCRPADRRRREAARSSTATS